jgi:hypothetical protein
VQKQSVSFVTPDGKQSRPFYFSQHRDHPSSVTWQVERSEFDQLLFDLCSIHIQNLDFFL